jgi:hypothetical protein
MQTCWFDWPINSTGFEAEMNLGRLLTTRNAWLFVEVLPSGFVTVNATQPRLAVGLTVTDEINCDSLIY